MGYPNVGTGAPFPLFKHEPDKKQCPTCRGQRWYMPWNGYVLVPCKTCDEKGWVPVNEDLD
jgi:hypothetical protein